MTAALLGPVGAAPAGAARTGSGPGSGDDTPGDSTFAGLLSVLAGSPAAGTDPGSPATATPTAGPGKPGRHAADDSSAQTPATEVAGTLVATVLATGGTVPLAVSGAAGSAADAIAATAAAGTAGAASTAIATAAAGALPAGSTSTTARPAPAAGHAGFAAALTGRAAPGAQPGSTPAAPHAGGPGTQPGSTAIGLPVTGPDGAAQPADPGSARPAPGTAGPVLPGAATTPTTALGTALGTAAPGTAALEATAKGGKRTHVTPQQPIDGDASTPAAPTQLGAAPAPTAAPAAPSAPSLPPVAAPAPGYAGRFIDPQPELSGALARLRSHGDGSHELTVSLHPAELGAVNVSATLHGDQLTVTVACSSDAARAAVTAALPTLHQQLAGAGFGGVDVQFGGPSQDPGHAGQQQAPGQDQPSGRHRAPEQTTTAPERRRPAQDAALDRLL